MGWGPLPGARGGGKRMATLGLRGQHAYASNLLRILPASSVAALASVSLSLSQPEERGPLEQLGLARGPPFSLSCAPLTFEDTGVGLFFWKRAGVGQSC